MNKTEDKKKATTLLGIGSPLKFVNQSNYKKEIEKLEEERFK